MELKGLNTLVVGLGTTGEAVCTFLNNRGARLMISEKRTPQEIGPVHDRWKKKAFRMEAGRHTEKMFLQSDLIITSPGVPNLALFEKARKRGIPVISEIELASRFLKGMIIGITGSNGKSTTATLTHKILKEAGLDAYLAGNIGTPLISMVDRSSDSDIYVTELSSFQLANIESFRAAIGVFLNLTPDHLDWHESFDDYYRAKTNLLTNQKSGDKAVLNRDDSRVWASRERARSNVFAFSRNQKVDRGIHVTGEWLVFELGGQEPLIRVDEIPLPGEHNQDNVMASALAARLMGVETEKIKSPILSFEGLAHRLKRIATISGITFYDDSKATNVDSCLKALHSFQQDIVLILGGRDKGGDFTVLRKPVEEKVKAIILLGEAGSLIKRALTGTAPMSDASSMRNAVRLAFKRASSQDIVLLAPACTSWDMYNNFEERGEDFIKEVHSLKKEYEAGHA